MTEPDEPPTGTAHPKHSPVEWIVEIGIPALIAYVPLLLTAPGQVAADTKTYLYLNPGKLLGDALYVWDSQIGLGTVTHQNIGYLWPMGPFYWVFDQLGVPDWVAQRLWLGSVILAAGLGVRYLLRTIGWGRIPGRYGGVLVAVLAYMLSPYLLNYSARISVILLPWAALPWLIGLSARALRTGGWRHPALFALVVLTVGGINATALLLVGFGPVLWFVHAVWIDREVSLRRALAALGRIAVLTLATSLWWMAGLWAEGKYGLPVIRYTETYKTVAELSTPPEVLRGLGYWFFYGSDKLGPWTESSVSFTSNIPLLAVSYLLPILGLLAAAIVRWRYRTFFVLIVVIGAITAIGANPWGDPSVMGRLFKAFTHTDAGLSLRSTPRAVPLVALGLAIFLGAGASAIGRRLPRLTIPVAALLSVLVVANIPTLWTGQMVAANLERPEDIPSYWTDAASYVSTRGNDTRVLAVPGSDFASYRWGNTVDPVLPGLTDRPYVARELFTWGSAPSANLLNAFDRRFHENDMYPQAIAPMSQVLAAGDLLVRSDLQYERYRIARPRSLFDLIDHAPGLGEPGTFGPPTPNIAGPEQPMIDEVELNTPRSLPDPAPVAIFPVTDPLPIVRTHSGTRPLLVAGDGDGIVDAASIGILDPRQASFYSGSYATDPTGLDRVLGSGADLLVTDSNRKRARRWGTLRETTGYTERAGETPLRYDPGDQRLRVFPEAGEDAYTLSEQRGVTATATGYGNPVTYTPNDRAAFAVDGDPQTAWRVGAVDDPVGQELELDLDQPTTTDHIGLLQPINLVRSRWITRARLTFDDGPSIDVTLDDSSRTEPGQTITFPERTFRHLEIEILDTDIGKRPRYDGQSGVGFAEVTIPGVIGHELIRPPTDLLDAAGGASIDHRLSFLFTRLRSNPAEPVRTDEEIAMVRLVDLPTDRSFAIGAQARLSAYTSDAAVDHLLGQSDASQGGVTVDASQRLPGAIDQRGSAALDGDPTTAWSNIFTKQEGAHLDVTVPQPTTFDHLDLTVVNDGRHSVPTRLLLVTDGDTAHPTPIDIPPIEDEAEVGGTTTVRVDFPPVTGSSFTFYLDAVREVKTKDWYSNEAVTMPVAIAELGIPGVMKPKAPPAFDSGCRSDLLSIDGNPVPLRVTGSTEDAVRRNELTVSPCGSDPDGVMTLAAGEHVVQTGIGRDLGIDIDRLLLASERGGAALPISVAQRSDSPGGPPVTITGQSRVSYDLQVDGTTEPFWLAVGQSWSAGWHATLDGRDLGPPQVIDGYGNGWLLSPSDGASLHVHVEWTPQKVVWIAIGLSTSAVVACLLLVVFGDRRRRRRDGSDESNREQALTDTPERPLDPDVPSWRTQAAVVARRPAMLGALGLGLFMILDVPVGWPMLLVPAVVGTAYAAWRSPRGRSVVGLLGVGTYGLAALYIVVSQWRHDFLSDFTWPLQFTKVAVLGLLTLYLLLGEGLRDLLDRTDDLDTGEP